MRIRSKRAHNSRASAAPAYCRRTGEGLEHLLLARGCITSQGFSRGHRVNPIPGTRKPVHWGLPTALLSMMAGLTGCVGQVWCNPDAPSAQTLTQAQYVCKTGNAQSNPDLRPDITVNTDPHALRTVSGGPIIGTGGDPFEFKACMEKSGYHYVPQQQCDAMAHTGSHAPVERCSLGATCVDKAPPPPKEDVMGASPAPGYIWMPGYYVYYGKTDYQWNDGHWEPARPGYHWNAPRWEQIGSTWIFTPGSWKRDN